MKSRAGPDWLLHFLKLENTVEGVVDLGTVANPRLKRIASEIECGGPQWWFELITAPLWGLVLGGEMAEYFVALREHAPKAHIWRVRDMLAPYLDCEGKIDPDTRAALYSDRTMLRLLIGCCDPRAAGSPKICYLEEYLVVKRRLGVVMVELPGDRLWLKLHERFY